MIEVLFVLKAYPNEESIIKEIEQTGCKVVCYGMDSNEQMQTIYTNLVMFLRNKTYHMICSVNFDEMLANAAYVTGTKYVSLQQDTEEKSLASEYVNYPTNYICMSDFMPYMQYRSQGLKTICYCINGFKDILTNVLSDEELQLYDIIRALEDYRNCNGKLEDKREKQLDEIYVAFSNEKRFWFQLKEKLLNYVDKFMNKGSIRGWEELIIWYNRNVTKEIIGQFWEFYILNIILKIYKEEYNSSGQSLSFAKFSSLQEVFDVYFKMIFQLRRIEYDVVPERHMEVIVLMKHYGLSDIFIKHMMENGQIENQQKVLTKLEKLWREYGYE